MSKTIIQPIALEVTKSSADNLMKMGQAFQDSLKGKVGEETEKRLSGIVKQYSQLSTVLSDTELDDESFKKATEALFDLNDEFENFVKLVTKELKLEIDFEALEKVQKEIEELTKKKKELEESSITGSRLATPHGRKAVTKPMLDTEMLKHFPHFDHNLQSIGIDIPKMKGTLVNLDAISAGSKRAAEQHKHLIALQEKLIEQGKELSKEDQVELAGLEATKEKREVIAGIVKNVEAQVKKEQEAYENNIKQQNEIIKKLEERRLAESKILTAGGEMGEVVSGVSTGLQTERATLEAVQTKQRQQEQEAADKLRADRLVGPSGKSEQAISGLLDKYFSMHAALAALRKMAQKTIQTISDLDAAFVSIAVVTQYTNRQVWGMYDAFSDIASGSGFSVAEVGNVAAEYFRQGESYSNVLQLTEAASKAAQVAGIEATDSVRYLTSAVKGYSLAASEAMMVSDKFAALAANTATNYEGLATAMSKVASQAAANGVEMDNLMGMMATAMEVTQEAPENIGTAFKTIFARMSEIKDYGKVLEDGVDANRIEKALKTVNVELFDQNKEMRALDDVLLEVGAGWGTLNRSQKAYIATALAGTRQQTRLLAVLENMEMTEKNIQTSRTSAGATEAQQLKNTESLAYNFNRMDVAYSRFTTNMANSKTLLKGVKAFATAVENVIGLTDHWSGRLSLYTLGLLAFVKVIRVATVAIGLNKYAIMDHATKNIAWGATIKSVTANLIFQAKVLAATPAGWAMLAAAAVIAGGALIAAAVKMGAFDSAAERAEKRIKKTTDEIKKLEGQLYNLNEKKVNLESLLKEFDELDAQVVKTNESLARQKEIIQLLNDADIDGEYAVVNADGTLNRGGVLEQMEDVKKEQQELFDKQLELGRELIKQEHDLVKASDIYYAARAKAIDKLADGEMSRWEELDEDIKKMAIDWETNILTGPKTYVDSAGRTYGDDDVEVQGTGFGWDRSTKTFMKRKKHKVFNKQGDLLSEVEQQEVDPAQLEALKAFNEQVVLSEISIKDYRETVLSIAPAQATANDALMRSTDLFQDLDTVSMATLSTIEDVFNNIAAYGVEMSDEIKISLANSFAIGDMSSFMSTVQKEFSKAGLGIQEMTQFAMNFSETIGGINYDGIVDLATEFDSVIDKIDNVNESLKTMNAESLAGAMELIDTYSEFPHIIDMMTESILQEGTINQATQEAMAEARKEGMESAIKNRLTALEAEIDIAEKEAEMWTAMLKDKSLLTSIAAKSNVDVSALSANEIAQIAVNLGKEWEDFFNYLMDASAQVGIDMPDNLAGVKSKRTTGISSNQRSGDMSRNIKAEVEAMTATVSAAAEGASRRAASLRGEQALLQRALNNLDAGTWNRSMDKIAKGADKAGKAAKDTTEEIEKYISKLDELYTIEQKLKIADWALDLIKIKEGYEESTRAAEDLIGVQDSLIDPNISDYSAERFRAYQLIKEELLDALEVTTKVRNSLKSDLDPALKGTYEIIKGRVIPIIAKQNKLSNEHSEALDEYAEKYNNLTEKIQEYTGRVYEAAEAQNQILIERRDAVIEYHKLMLETIKNEERKQIESFKKIIDANVKYLQERKKLYEQSFKDEDEEQSLSEMEERRAEIIEKLANLESAHDLTSAQRKAMYLKELQDLNDDYNQLMLERNRAALMTSLDDQIEYQNETYQKEEEAYQDRITSNEWLENRLKQIQDEARTYSIMKNFLHNMTMQEMLNNGYITQKELTEAGITDMNTRVNELNEEQKGVFQKYWEENRDIIDKMWNDAETGGVNVSEDAMDHILDYLKEHSAEMQGTTGLMRAAIQQNWKDMLVKVNEYTQDFNGIHLKGPDHKDLDITLDKVDGRVEETKDDAEDNYDDISKGTIGPMSEVQALRAEIDALSRQKIRDKSFTVTQINRVVNETVTTSNRGSNYSVGGLAMPRGETYMPMATGGTTERTGLHWLDGKPGAPERVLSPGANKRFEELLGTLTLNHSQPQDNKEVVNSLMTVVKAVYDSSQDSAETITKAIREIETSDKGMSIKSIASSHGISLNRRGDK